jgi:hypothetical protein
MPLQLNFLDDTKQINAFKLLLESGKEYLTEVFCIPDQSDQGPIGAVRAELGRFKAQNDVTSELYERQLKLFTVCPCYLIIRTFGRIMWTSRCI